MLNPPGSYCAYASVYLTVCLIRIFGLATKTYLEQQLHVGIIQVGGARAKGPVDPSVSREGGKRGVVQLCEGRHNPRRRVVVCVRFANF